VQPDHHQPGRDRRAFPGNNHYVGNLPPMPGVFPDYPAPVVRNDDTFLEMVPMRNAAPTTGLRIPGDEYQEYLVAALARLADSG
jgi:hypothetical protein